MGRMFGWSRLAAASASARKRCTSSAAGEFPGQDHLQGHDAVQAHLPGPVDHAHAAAGDLVEQLVVAEILDAAEQRRQRPARPRRRAAACWCRRGTRPGRRPGGCGRGRRGTPAGCRRGRRASPGTPPGPAGCRPRRRPGTRRWPRPRAGHGRRWSSWRDSGSRRVSRNCRNPRLSRPARAAAGSRGSAWGRRRSSGVPDGESDKSRRMGRRNQLPLLRWDRVRVADSAEYKPNAPARDHQNSCPRWRFGLVCRRPPRSFVR